MVLYIVIHVFYFSPHCLYFASEEESIMMTCSFPPFLFLSYISALREFLEMRLVLWERWGWGVVAEEGGGMIGGRIRLPLLTFVFILAFRNILMSQQTIIETLFSTKFIPQ